MQCLDELQNILSSPAKSSCKPPSDHTPRRKDCPTSRTLQSRPTRRLGDETVAEFPSLVHWNASQAHLYAIGFPPAEISALIISMFVCRYGKKRRRAVHFIVNCCHPTMCIMRINVDHSWVFPRKKNETTGNSYWSVVQRRCDALSCANVSYWVVLPAPMTRTLFQTVLLSYFPCRIVS